MALGLPHFQVSYAGRWQDPLGGTGWPWKVLLGPQTQGVGASVGLLCCPDLTPGP